MIDCDHNNAKRQAIKATFKTTRAKRKLQKCRVFEFKVTAHHLSTHARTHLRRLFLEAKCFYNWVLIQPNVYHVDTKVKEIPSKVGDVFEKRPLGA